MLPGLIALTCLACGKEEDPPPPPTCANRAAFGGACNDAVTKADLARVVGRWRVVTLYGGFAGCLEGYGQGGAGGPELTLEFFADGTYELWYDPADTTPSRSGRYVLGESADGPALVDERDTAVTYEPIVSHLCGGYLVSGTYASTAVDGAAIVYERR